MTSMGNAADFYKDEAFLGLRQMIMAFRTTVLVHAAAELKLPDLIAQGLDNSTELAHHLHISEAMMGRLLRALVSLELFEMTIHGRLRLNANQLLREAMPGSLRNTALFYGNQRLLGSYALLSEIVRTGRSALRSSVWPLVL